MLKLASARALPRRCCSKASTYTPRAVPLLWQARLSLAALSQAGRWTHGLGRESADFAESHPGPLSERLSKPLSISLLLAPNTLEGPLEGISSGGKDSIAQRTRQIFQQMNNL